MAVTRQECAGPLRLAMAAGYRARAGRRTRSPSTGRARGVNDGQANATMAGAVGRQREVAGLAAVFFSMLGYALVIPVLPQLLDEAALGPTVYGMAQSSANFVALFSATAIGRVSDVRGRRFAAMLCAGVGLLGSLLLGAKVWAALTVVLPLHSSVHALAATIAVSLPMLGLILRRVERNSSKGVLEALCTDSTGASMATTGLATTARLPQDRLPQLARLNTAFSLGFTAGSSAGGALSSVGNGAVVGAATACATLTLAIEGTFLPASDPIVEAKQGKDAAAGVPATPGTGDIQAPVPLWQTLRGFAQKPRIVALLLSRGLCGLAFFVLTGTFDLFCRSRFEMSSESYGYFLSFIGGSFAVCNGLLIPLLHKLSGGGKKNELRLLVGGMVILGCGRAVLSIAYSIPVLVIGDLLVAIGGSSVGSATPALLSRQATPSTKGVLLGVSNSVHSVAGVVGPTLSGILYERVGDGAPAAVAALLCAIATLGFLTLWGSILPEPRAGKATKTQ